MANREIADIAREQNALGSMNGHPARHRFIDRGILQKGIRRRLPHHVEMDGIMADAAALAQLPEFDALNLK